ncbi:hypothetical protein [Streptomyces sp. V3I7]|uniref:hypothetical protein n=1 Tax=Streptomyces sp. V3I7 TaxID=3042278 RepID=UPI00278BA9F2|nr:hypothetical protein [Streptomyces sp. V3I7]MDQ0993907.1 hypothetical protein [Streptomyces sp. V3I7]
MQIAELVLKYVQALVWPVVTVALVWFQRDHLRAAFARMTRVETPAGAIEFAAEARDVLNQAEWSADAGLLPVPPYQPQAQQPAEEDVDEPVYGSPPPLADQGAAVPRGGTEPTATGPGYGIPPPVQPPAPVPTVVGAATDGGRQPGSWRHELQNARDMVDTSPAGAVVTAWDALDALCSEVLSLRNPFMGTSRPAETETALVSMGLSPSAVAVYGRLRQLRNRAVHGAQDVTPRAARDFVDSCLTVAREVEGLVRYMY